MNKQRRKELHMLVEKLKKIIHMNTTVVDLDEMKEFLDDIKSDLELLYGDEESYMDNIPENLQESIRYEKAEAACDNLENAVDYLDYAIESDTFDEMMGYINDTINFICQASL